MDRYQVRVTKSFVRDLKQLRKRYKKLKEDLEPIWESLAEHPNQGDSVGKFRKVDVPSQDMQSGGSGGFRMWTLPKPEDQIVYTLWLLTKKDDARLNHSQRLDEIKSRIKTELQS